MLLEGVNHRRACYRAAVAFTIGDSIDVEEELEEAKKLARLRVLDLEALEDPSILSGNSLALLSRLLGSRAIEGFDPICDISILR